MEIKVKGSVTQDELSVLNSLGNSEQLWVVMDPGTEEASQDDIIGFAHHVSVASSTEGETDNGTLVATMALLHPHRYFPEHSFELGVFEGIVAVIQKPPQR